MAFNNGFLYITHAGRRTSANTENYINANSGSALFSWFACLIMLVCAWVFIERFYTQPTKQEKKQTIDRYAPIYSSDDDSGVEDEEECKGCVMGVDNPRAHTDVCNLAGKPVVVGVNGFLS